MGYRLRAIVAAAGLLEAEARDLPHAVLVPLEQGLAMLPITSVFFDSVAVPGTPAADSSGLKSIPSGFDATLAAWSRTAPVAFVDADFFGGVGFQEAAAWADGRLVLGPLRLEPREQFGLAGSPISQALRVLGAVAPWGSDEFEAVGLRQHRHITEDIEGLLDQD